MNNIDNILKQLKDIKPNVEVHEYSLYYLLALIGAILIVLLIALFIWYKNYKKKQRRLKKSSKYKALEALKNIDFNSTKEAVYNFSKYAQLLANNEQKSKLKEILNSLEKYKFKKETKPLSKEDIKAMKSFINKLKVKDV